MNAQEFIDVVMNEAESGGEGTDSTVVVVDRHGNPYPVEEVYWDDELEAVVVEFK
jgi:hypothetical protein